MALRQLRYDTDEILHKRCREVPTVDDKIRAVLDDMAETMYANQGAGLAACQVGILKRLVVIDMMDGKGLYKLVNPVILEQSGRQECMEACLSFPGLAGKTVRPQRVVVESLDEQGEKYTLIGEGELAKCLCHELDHLDGVVYTEKALSLYRNLPADK